MDPNESHDVLINKNSIDVDDSPLISQRSLAFVTFDCPEPHCVMQFRREDRLRAYMLLGSHKILRPSFRILDAAMLTYKEGVESDTYKQVPIMSAIIMRSTMQTASKNTLSEGWALFRSRPRVTISVAQRSDLEDKYNEGEKSGSKWDPARVAEVKIFRTLTVTLINFLIVFRICR